MRCKLVVLAAVVSGVLSWTGAEALAARAQDGPDSSAKALEGAYTSNTTPPSHVLVRTFPRSLVLVTIVGEPSFEGAGFWDGEQFVGILARPDGSVPRGPSGGPAWLRFKPLKDGRLEVERSLTSLERDVRREVWTRTADFSKPAAPPSGLDRGDRSNPADSLPKFGEYVYVEELPEVIEKVPPAYPEWARAKGIQGTVIVQALVGRDGLVKNTRIAASIPDLDDYAIAAVKQWRFKPAQTKGEPIAVWVAVPVKFTLH